MNVDFKCVFSCNIIHLSTKKNNNSENEFAQKIDQLVKTGLLVGRHGSM